MVDWKEEIRKRLAGLKLEPTRETQIVDELAQHLDDRYGELVSAGATEKEAVHAVLAELSVRFSGDGAALARAVNATIRDVAPELSFCAAPQTIQSFREELMENVWNVTQLIAFICVIAVSLALIGIYGVVAFAVSQRTKEMGIRLALGAKKKGIYQAIIETSSRPVAVGLLLGLAITVATCAAIAQILRDQEFSFNVEEPIAYTVTAVLLGCVALIAMLIPARRATKVDPMIALREE